MDIFKKGKFELLPLMETKLKGKGEVSWSGLSVIFAGVHEKERAREGVAILLNDVWHSAVLKSGYVSSRILWIKFKFQRLKFVWRWGTAPMKEMVKKEIGSVENLIVHFGRSKWMDRR